MTRAVRCTYQVIYGDTDQMGVVYYANYLRFFERGRMAWLRAMGLDYRALEATGTLVPVVDVRCRYRRPARFEDELVIETTLGEVGRARFRLHYQVLRRADGALTLLAEGDTSHACMRADGRPTRLPVQLEQALRAQP